MNSRSENYFVPYLREHIADATTFGKAVHLQWVPADNGVPGNIQANKIATAAHWSNSIHLTRSPRSFAKRSVMYRLRDRMFYDMWLNRITENSLLYLVYLLSSTCLLNPLRRLSIASDLKSRTPAAFSPG